MAAYSAIRRKHATLAGTAADLVTLSGVGSSLAVTNRHATNVMYFRFDSTTAVAAADETFVVLAAQTKVVQIHGTPLPISVVGTDNPYSVEIF